MNPMNTAPRTGEAILAKVKTSSQWPYRIVRYREFLVSGSARWAEHYHWESENRERLREADFSGWYDLDALIADRARMAELLRKALVYVPTIARVTPEGCDEAMTQPHPLRGAIERELER